MLPEGPESREYGRTTQHVSQSSKPNGAEQTQLGPLASPKILIP